MDVRAVGHLGATATNNKLSKKQRNENARNAAKSTMAQRRAVEAIGAVTRLTGELGKKGQCNERAEGRDGLIVGTNLVTHPFYRRRGFVGLFIYLLTNRE
jgi:hypothetical protein